MYSLFCATDVSAVIARILLLVVQEHFNLKINIKYTYAYCYKTYIQNGI